MSEMKIERDLEDKIKASQESDPLVDKIKGQIKRRKSQDFVVFEKGLLKFRSRILYPLKKRLRKKS